MRVALIQSIRAAAALFGIPHTTIQSWLQADPEETERLRTEVNGDITPRIRAALDAYMQIVLRHAAARDVSPRVATDIAHEMFTMLQKLKGEPDARTETKITVEHVRVGAPAPEEPGEGHA